MATSAFDKIYQSVGRKPSDSCLYDDCAATSRLEDSLIGLYDDIWENEEFIDLDEPCSCGISEDNGRLKIPDYMYVYVPFVLETSDLRLICCLYRTYFYCMVRTGFKDMHLAKFLWGIFLDKTLAFHMWFV